MQLTLSDRVVALRNGLRKQPFALLSWADPSLETDARRCRRILCNVKVFPGDETLIAKMEAAKAKLYKIKG